MGASVIIPAYNARRTLPEVLGGLRGQSYRDFEVVVVDDESNDGTPQWVCQFAASYPFPIKLVSQPHAGPARGRNEGVNHASYDIVVFLDSDCIPPPNWLEAMVKPLGGEVVACCCGYWVRNRDRLVARYVGFETNWRWQRLVGKGVDSVPTNSAAFDKQVFLRVGGFDTSFTAASGEDFDLSFRLRHLGYRMVSTQETFVYHYHPGTLGKYLRQQFIRGYWRVPLYLRNREKILAGDSYTGYEAQAGFLSSHLALLSIPLALAHPALPLLGFGLLVLAHVPLGLWAFREERKFLVLAPLIASLRSLAGTLGAWNYVLSAFYRRLRSI